MMDFTLTLNTLSQYKDIVLIQPDLGTPLLSNTLAPLRNVPAARFEPILALDQLLNGRLNVSASDI